MAAVMELRPVDDLTAQPTAALESEVRTLAAHIAAATCRFLLLVGELDRREAWREWECRSCAHWLAWQCGVSVRTGYDQVRVGRALADLPEITRAFAAGQLSYSKARALTRVATPESERELVELALHATATHLDRIVGGYERVRRLADPDLAAAQLRQRNVWRRQHEEGTVTYHQRLTPEVAARFEAALEAASEMLPDAVEEATPSHFPSGTRRADAFDLILREFTSAASEHGPPADVVVHIDVETVANDRPGRCDVEGGPDLTAETARRLACDARLTVALDRLGETVDVGRRFRSVPPVLRRAIVDRDHATCRFPTCTSRRRLQVHHRRHWAHGGPTSKTNLSLVCSHHHRALHEGGWHADGDPDRELRFVSRTGRRLPEHPHALPRSDPYALGREHAREGPRVGPGTIAARRRAGETLDLGHAVAALACLAPPDTS